MADRIITAIDIGSSKIATVIALQEAGKAPSLIGVSSYPSQGLKKGVIVNIDEAINSIAASLEAAERMAGITVSSVYISINGKHITSTNNKGVVAVAQDEINPDDIFRAIETAKTVSIPPSREILHVIPRQFIVDAQGDIKDPIGMTGNRLEVDTHIISATSSALHNLIKCITQIGLKIDDVVFSGWAAANSVLTNTEKELGIVLLDIGGGTTTITTFVEDAITYSGSVPFGGANVTSDIAIGLRVNLEDAEKIKLNADELTKNYRRPVLSEATKKRQLLLNPKTRDNEEEVVEDTEDEEPETKRKDIIDVSSLEVDGMKTISKKLFDDIIEARLSEIFDIVIEQIVQSGNEARLPAGVVITGGSSMIPGITSIAKKVFGVPSRVGYPKGLDGLTDEISSPSYAVVQGLILSGASDETYSAGKRQISLKAGKESNLLSKIGGFFKNLMP